MDHVLSADCPCAPTVEQVLDRPRWKRTTNLRPGMLLEDGACVKSVHINYYENHEGVKVSVTVDGGVRIIPGEFVLVMTPCR